MNANSGDLPAAKLYLDMSFDRWLCDSLGWHLSRKSPEVHNSF